MSATFRYAICNELFHDRSLEQGMREARALGYTGLEIAPFTLAPMDHPYACSISKAAREKVCDLAASIGMEVIGLHWLLAKTQGFHLTTRDSEVRRKTAAYFEELIELCADLGGNIMVLGSPQQRNFPAEMSHSEAMANAADTIRLFTKSLEQKDITLAIEPLGPTEGNFLNYAHQGRELVQWIDSPKVKLHLDVKAMSTEGTSIASIIQQNADILVHFHANDPNLLGPGMGEVPFEPIFAALRNVGYAGWVSVEVFDYSPGVGTILQKSMESMKRAELACAPRN